MEENDKYNQLISAFYQKHKKVLDYIFNNKPDLRSDIMDKIYAELEKDTDIVMYAKTSKYISFYPKEWKDIECIKDTSRLWYNKKEMGLLVELKFETQIKNQKDILSISNYVVLGPIEKNRQDIINTLKAEEVIINKNKTVNNKNHLTFLSNTKKLESYIFSEEDDSDNELNNKAVEIVEKIKDHIKSDTFKKLTTALKNYKVGENIYRLPQPAMQDSQ